MNADTVYEIWTLTLSLTSGA